MYIIFEGLDKTGKTTLINKIQKQTKWKWIIRDRLVGWLAYDEIYNRGTELRRKTYIADVRSLLTSNNYFIVYCKTNLPTVNKRLKEHNEELDYDYLRAQKIYDECVYSIYPHKKVLELDTTNLTTDECITRVLKAAKIAELENYEDKEKNIVMSTYALGGKIFNILSKGVKQTKHLTEEETHAIMEIQTEERNRKLSIIRDGNQINLVMHEYPYLELALVDDSLFGNNPHKDVVCKLYNILDPYSDKIYTADFIVEGSHVAGLKNEDLDMVYSSLINLITAVETTIPPEINIITIVNENGEEEDMKERNDKKGKDESKPDSEDDEFVFDA